MASDILKHTRGNRSTLPILLDGQIAILEDEGRLVIGTVSGNVDIPSQLDRLDINTSINGAINTANLATSNIAQALVTANLAKTTADGAMTTSNSTQAQVANIITSNGTGKDSELVDVRTDSSSVVWASAGLHVRNLDTTNSILKSIQIFTATVDNTSIIPIAPAILVQVDITKIALDVYDFGQLLKVTVHYTIDQTNKNIVLNGWTLATGETLQYRVYM